jgi:hypothetical protein
MWKSLIISVLIGSICLISYAQKYGIRTGLNLLPSIYSSYPDYDDDHGIRLGYNLGVTADITKEPIFNHFSFETGFNISKKGMKEIMVSHRWNNNRSYWYYIEETYVYNLLYFEIPLNIKTTFRLKQAKIFSTLGPYLDLGIGGNYNGPEGKLNIDWGSGPYNNCFRRSDVGLSVGLGFEIKSFQIGASASRGLTNISGNLLQYNRSLSVTLGYVWVKKKTVPT